MMVLLLSCYHWKPKQRDKMNYAFLRKGRGKLKLLKFET